MRRLLRLQSVTQNASRRGRLHDLWRAVIKPDFPRELYPFIYCLTILGVFYAATVGFYRCTFFRILFCTFYAAFIREFLRFTSLKKLYSPYLAYPPYWVTDSSVAGAARASM